MTKETYYYQVYLEVSRPGADEVFGFINISHISYEKFEELFKDQIRNERFMFEDVSYKIDQELYIKHQEFLDAEVPFKFNFELFKYWVALAGDEISKYKKDYYEELPGHLDKR